MPQYSQGLWGSDRTGVGAFNFDTPTEGHIGAFYLNDAIDCYVNIDTIPLYIAFTDTVPIVSDNTYGVDIIIDDSNRCFLYLNVLPQTVTTFSDIELTVTADQWFGNNPLPVNFNANILYNADFVAIYQLDYINWYFDADNTTAYTSGTTAISTSFDGHFNQSWGVKAQAHFKLKSGAVAPEGYGSTYVKESIVYYVTVYGLTQIRYGDGDNILLDLVTYLPGMHRNTDVETIMSNIYQDYWNTMFEGSGQFSISETQKVLTQDYTNPSYTISSTTYKYEL